MGVPSAQVRLVQAEALVRTLDIVVPGQPVDGPPLAFRGPPGTAITRRNRRAGTRDRTRIEVLVKPFCRVGRTAPLRKRDDLQNAHPVERDGHDVAGRDAPACGVDTHPVDAHLPAVGERSRRAARAHDPRVPQPFIDALAIQAREPIRVPWRRLQAAP